MYSLLVAAMPVCHWSALNTPKTLGVPQPRIQSVKVRWSWRPDECVSRSCPLITKSLVKVLSDSAETKRQCPLMLEEVHVPRALVSYWSKRRRYTQSVSLLGKRTGPKIWTPKLSTHTLAKNQRWCLDARVAWGLSFTQTWDLWSP